MNDLWDNLISLQDEFIKKFSDVGVEIFEPGMDHFNQLGWMNKVWQTESVRRCHIDVVDVRDTKKLWMMHVCIFPNLDNTSPIFGFDVISGKNKMTGAFHDFSATTHKDHFMIKWFADSVSNFVPVKRRPLPEWALNIFSPSMVAASNVNTEAESLDIIMLTLKNLNYYFDNVSESNGRGIVEEVSERQNYYCDNQKKNPHTPKVMKSLGLDEEDVNLFCSDILFPRINIGYDTSQ